MDRKYGRIFTEPDVEKVIEHVVSELASDELDTPELVQNEVDTFMEELFGQDEDAIRVKFERTEPTFTLRARDTRAIAAIRFYLDHQSPRAPSNHTEGIEKALKEFEDYRRYYPDQIKEPD